MGKRLRTLHWACHQTGDCCRAVDEVLMTKEEAEALRPLVSDEKWGQLVWTPGPPDTRGLFVKLKAFPCPLLDADGKCTVHAARPYNCRRFGCLRSSTTEPFIPDHGEFGCGNTREGLRDRDLRRDYALMQQKGMRWALAHGWRNV